MSTSVYSLPGIYEKLKRADENIHNLDCEMTAFLKKGENVIVGNEDLEMLAQKGEYQATREPPLRFSVLAGEIIHHFRSTLDHAAWALARPGARRRCPRKIAFPIFHDRFDKRGLPILKGKIELFASNSVRDIISRVQPYEGADPSSDLLWLIHDLDIKAKHRELPLMNVGFDLGSPQLNALAMLYATDPSKFDTADVARQLQENMHPSPLIAFREFSKGQPSPVTHGLRQLKGEVRYVIDLLEDELMKC